jgi:hypothetical protein
MIDDREQPDLDARLRAAFAPDAAAVRRVVRRALAADAVAPPIARAAYRAAAIALALVVCVGALVWSVRAPRRARSAASPASLSITGRGALVSAAANDGRRWIVGAPPPPSRGSYVIVLSR